MNTHFKCIQRIYEYKELRKKKEIKYNTFNVNFSKDIKMQSENLDHVSQMTQ